MSPRLVVVTGGPFSGKTTLVRELSGLGYTTVPEAAIDVIRRLNDRMGVAGQRSWRRSHVQEFQRMVFDLQVEREEALDPGPDPVFLDRGLADGIAYCLYQGVEPLPVFRERAASSGYERAFVLDTLEGFDGRGESGRMSSRQDSLDVGRLLTEVYEAIGVDVVQVGPAPVGGRVQTLLRSIES